MKHPRRCHGYHVIFRQSALPAQLTGCHHNAVLSHNNYAVRFIILLLVSSNCRCKISRQRRKRLRRRRRKSGKRRAENKEAAGLSEANGEGVEEEKESFGSQICSTIAFCVLLSTWASPASLRYSLAYDDPLALIFTNCPVRPIYVLMPWWCWSKLHISIH